jgi:hypothetical protein
MKKIIAMLGTLFVLASFNIAQSDTDEIIKGFKMGNADQVATYFDNFLDLTLPGKDEIKNIGKNQAGITLQAFFSENDVKGFDVTSQRESGIMMYITGKLQTKAKGYNVTLLLKNKDGKHQVTSIRIS